MSLLTDTDLKEIIVSDRNAAIAESLVITPYEDDSLTPVGYDLRVGATYATSNKIGRKTLKPGESLEIRPRSTALVSTLERIEMPSNRMLSGLIKSKVTKVSMGLSHLSTTIDADWRGNLLIAIHNHSGKKEYLKYGEPFCTAVFLENLSPSTRASDKDEGRSDVFLNEFEKGTKSAELKKILLGLIPFPIILVCAGLGYWKFGDGVEFQVSALVGIAFAHLVAEMRR